MANGKLIFVTGGTGFVGRHLLKRLRNRGDRVRLLARHPEKVADLRWEGLEIVNGAVEDPDIFGGRLEGVDAIVHMASVYREKDRKVFEAIHVEGTKRLLEEAQKTGDPKVVFVSTNAAGDDKWGHYGTTKREAEMLIEAGPVDWTILRPTILYGPNDDKNLLFLAKLAKTSPILPTMPKGLAPLQPAHVFDLLQAIEAGIDNPGTSGKTYVIAGPDPVPMWTLWKGLCDAAGKKRLLVPVPIFALRTLIWLASMLSKNPGASSDKVDNFLKGRHYDLEPARRDFGYAPRAYEEGIKSVVFPDKYPTP